jgi:hypothetical protein
MWRMARTIDVFFFFSFNSLVYLSRMARKLTIFCLSHDVRRPLITLGWFLSVLWTQQYKLDDIWATFTQILMLLFHCNLGVIIIWPCLLSLELGWDAGIVCFWKIGLTSAITFALYGHHPIFLSFSLSSTWCLIINVEISQDYHLLTTFFWVFPL